MRSQLLNRTAIAARRHARGNRRHGRRIQRIDPGRPGEAGECELPGVECTRPRSPNLDALPTQHHLAARRATTHRAATCIRHASRLAQRRPIGFHHRRQHLLADLYAQADKSILRVVQNPLHRQRNLKLRIPNGLQAGLRARLHIGGFFLCLVGTRMIPCGRKEPPPSLHQINRVRDIASTRASGTSRGHTMNTMSFKGYTARVEYDERDDIFVGRILGIRSIISFHGQTVAGLRSEFQKAVKEYLSDCKSEGLSPERPASGKLLLRVPPEIHGRALVAAQVAGKSLNQWATEVLQDAVEPAGS